MAMRLQFVHSWPVLRSTAQVFEIDDYMLLSFYFYYSILLLLLYKQTKKRKRRSDRVRLARASKVGVIGS